ncbi:MAG: class I SAM-dependent methyltransferase [Syntrophomonas sp.]|jgi:ubiquinone/menaquinone biosynthesis C-methylase UbiE|uniref:class I SAM-dependent methyltransferase n=1 Tax=Syntrophomonas sp. TaxID=2053627 RepID=UPI000773BB26|nr:class I SAM-dependent methyltransferase [Syntrophomonas sp.]MDD4627641.1 class I SAM-dependent methyltransferase [Syntrophomonas sp.]
MAALCNLLSCISAPSWRTIIKRIALLLQPEDRVLEIAAGTGIIALGLADRMQNIDAIDFSPSMVAKAQKKAQHLGLANVHFSAQNACDLRFAPGSFDAVIICNTLHIMPEPEKALAESHRVLKPDGRLIAPTFVHAGSKKALLFFALMSLSGLRAYHKWTQQSFHAFLEENAFTVLDSVLLKASFPLAYVVARPKQ